MKISKTTWAVMTAGGLLLAGFSSQAVPITGGVSMSGSYTLAGSLASGSVSFTSFSGVSVTSGSGSYAVVPGGTAVPTYTPFSAVSSSAPIIPLWSFTYLGNTYSFDLASLSVDSRGTLLGNDFLNLSGTGTLHITGYTDTVGSWTFKANSSSATFANSSSATFSFSPGNQALPDGGSTVILLGSALAVLGMARLYFGKA